MAYIEVNFLSDALFRTVPVQVILPVDKRNARGLQPEQAFKTLYLLHGLLGDQTDWVTGTRIKRWAEEKNLAVVMPTGENGFYVDQPDTGRMYGTFIGEELVEMTRRMFPLSRRREDTFIGGLSMGGFGALRNGLKYNKTFSHIINLSGALHVLEDPATRGADTLAFEASCFGDLKEAVTSDKNPRYLIQQLAARKEKDPALPLPRIFQACGTEDELLKVNRDYRDLLLEKNWDLTYEETPGRHDWDFWDTYIKKALEWLPLEDAAEGLSSGHITV